MTSAYPRSYLPDAKAHLASCTDYLVNACRIAADRVGYIYVNFPVMRMFERGDPGVVAGISGLELGQRIYRTLYGRDSSPEAPPRSNGRSVEYWGGWALAHFQWQWDKSFKWIFARTTMSGILSKYPVYHEMDITRFLEDFKDELDSVDIETNLGRLRHAAGLSQSGLAKLSGIHLRNIQLYEQRVQDINHASAARIRELAKCLSCSIEDLME